MVLLEQLHPRAHQKTSRIEIIGVFGSGKTTFAKRFSLASGFQHLAEDHTKNLFWGNSSASERAGPLPYELSFLIQHAYLSASDLPGENNAVCDWSYATDRLWASLRLGEEISAYDATADAIIKRIGEPIGYFYLRQSPEVILERIKSRGRSPEKKFSEYIKKAVDQVDELAERLPSNSIKVVGDNDVESAVIQASFWKKRTRHE